MALRQRLSALPSLVSHMFGSIRHAHVGDATEVRYTERCNFQWMILVVDLRMNVSGTLRLGVASEILHDIGIPPNHSRLACGWAL